MHSTISRHLVNGERIKCIKKLCTHALVVTPHVFNMSFDQLAQEMSGTGKARIMWTNLSAGQDPLITDNADTALCLSQRAKDSLKRILSGAALIPGVVTDETTSSCGTTKLLVR